MSDERIIYHIVPADYYNNLPGDQPYIPQRFAEEGFIHCTRGEERTLLVANTVYRKKPDNFLLLVIDEHKVQPEIRHEIVGEILFPHIYGPLNRDAITRVQEMVRAPDGTFLTIGAPPEPATPLDVHPTALAAAASIEDVLAETRRLRTLATERIAVLEEEIQAFRQGRPYTPPPTPTVPVEVIQEKPAPTVEQLTQRIEKIEQSIIDLRSILVDRLDTLEARVKTLEKKPAPRKTTAKTKPGKSARKSSS
jgi:uncharacterized protein (DUF952 family)